MKKWIWAALPAVILGGYTSVAVYSGSKAEEELKSQLAQLNLGQELTLEWAKYDRGIFSSKVVLDVIFTPKENDSMFRHSIPMKVVHGPLLMDTAFAFRPAMFGIKGALISREDWPQDVKAFLADDRVHFETFVTWGGKNMIEFTVDGGELALSLGKLELSELYASANYNLSDKTYSARGNWDGLELQGLMGEVSVKNWTMDWSGTMYDLQTGEGEGFYKLESVKTTQAGKETFAVSDLVMSAKNTLTDERRQMNMDLGVTLGQVNAQGQNLVSNLVFDLSMNKLSVAGFKALNELSKQGEDLADPSALMGDIGRQLLEYSPDIQAKLIADQIMQQPVLVNANIVLPNMNEGFNPEWMNGIAFKMDGKVPLMLLTMSGMPMDLVSAIGKGETDAKGTSFILEWKDGGLMLNGAPFQASTSDDSEYSTESYSEEPAQDETCGGEGC